MSTTYLESFGADLSENKLFQCVSILLTDEYNALLSVFKSSYVQFFYLKTRQLATTTGLDCFRYSETATGPLKTGPNWSTTQKRPVQTSCDRFFVVKFIVPNKTNITSRKLHIWIDILIPCRLVKGSSNFVKIWLRYGENRRDIHLSCL